MDAKVSEADIGPIYVVRLVSQVSDCFFDLVLVFFRAFMMCICTIMVFWLKIFFRWMLVEWTCIAAVNARIFKTKCFTWSLMNVRSLSLFQGARKKKRSIFKPRWPKMSSVVLLRTGRLFVIFFPFMSL